ncbi:MAG TPA: hypothetical protein VNT55_22080 [Baekduia sp.]|nr:hypothetical protein [Baekduia sp.]
MTSYEISVRGHLDPGLLAELGAGDAEERPASTILHAELTDDAGLRVVLDRLHALGLELLEVRQVDGGRAGP